MSDAQDSCSFTSCGLLVKLKLVI